MPGAATVHEALAGELNEVCLAEYTSSTTGWTVGLEAREISGYTSAHGAERPAGGVKLPHVNRSCLPPILQQTAPFHGVHLCKLFVGHWLSPPPHCSPVKSFWPILCISDQGKSELLETRVLLSSVVKGCDEIPQSTGNLKSRGLVSGLKIRKLENIGRASTGHGAGNWE